MVPYRALAIDAGCRMSNISRQRLSWRYQGREGMITRTMIDLAPLARPTLLLGAFTGGVLAGGRAV